MKDAAIFPLFHPDQASEDSIALDQLRHLTKNALQRVIAQIAGSGLRATPAGNRLADDLEDRICLSARLSDALFGMTARPASLHRRLTSLIDSTIALLADAAQTIETKIVVAGSCPAELEGTLVQVAHEMVGNAVKHGMHLRLIGRISVTVAGDRDVTLTVCDDGWGPCCSASDTPGDGMRIMRRLAQQFGGTVSLDRMDGWTICRMRVKRKQSFFEKKDQKTSIT